MSVPRYEDEGSRKRRRCEGEARTKYIIGDESAERKRKSRRRRRKRRGEEGARKFRRL